MSSFGEPVHLRGDVLPTELEIYNHYLYKCASGDWTKNTELLVRVQSVREDVSSIWDKTGIPHGLHGREGKKRIQSLIFKGRKMNKVAMDRRGENYGKDLERIFDAALCNHVEVKTCNCTPENKVVYSEILKDEILRYIFNRFLRLGQYFWLTSVGQGC